MKKMFFYAALASVAFVSCTKEQGIELPNNGESEAAARIEFKMHNNINMATRSTGAVGDTIGSAKNVWNNQELNVFMFKQNTLTLAQEEFSVGAYVTKRAIFDNAKVVAPAGRDSVSADYGYEAKYYPATGAYDFFAYYDDDAAGASPLIENITIATGDTLKRLGISINGSQDLMVAKAIPSAADKAKYLQDATAAKNDADCKRFYSAYTARRGVQPVLTFEHLLTRFVFYVSSDSAKYCDPDTGITIDAIAIKDIQYKGKMVVAYTANRPDKMITWDGDKTTLWLQQRKSEANDTVKTLVAKNPEWNTVANCKDTVRVGESLLVPTQDEYSLEIYYSQRPNKNAPQPTDWDVTTNGAWEDSEYVNRVYSSVYTTKIVPSSNVAGTQYNVYFNVFGLEKIELDVKLTGWELGEDVDINNDDWD